MPSEFSLIEQYFAKPAATQHPRATLGIGDDCALLAPTPGMHLAISTDMLIEGRHFFPDVDPKKLGHKALAVNLSDLAAMGAEPRAFTLGLSMPDASHAWLSAFSEGMFQLAGKYGCELIGGDTTRGPNVSICITVFGDVPPSLALRRDAAAPGDDIWISGTLGNARAGLGLRLGEWSVDDPAETGLLLDALEQPEPRVELGLALRGIAHAALDLSDGLAGDLMHILKRSNVRANVNMDLVPRSAVVAALPHAAQAQCTLAGGDDYELCFTAPPEARAKIDALAERMKLQLTRIGTIEGLAGQEDAPAIHWHNQAGPASASELGLIKGFDHFHAD